MALISFPTAEITGEVRQFDLLELVLYLKPDMTI
jgi:hypothetical protein